MWESHTIVVVIEVEVEVVVAITVIIAVGMVTDLHSVLTYAGKCPKQFMYSILVNFITFTHI